jgi:predicted adenine nucleotide alpha hydrolase (AANH) superfamily ATPase
LRAKANILFIDMNYDTDNWFARARGMEREGGRGQRCTICHDMHFNRTALYAHQDGFPVITSFLGLSRWKNPTQVTARGICLRGLTNQDHNWRQAMVRSAWSRPASASSSINKNFVVAPISFAIPIFIAGRTAARRS